MFYDKLLYLLIYIHTHTYIHIYIYIYIYLLIYIKNSGKPETVHRYPKYIVPLAKPLQPPVRY